MTPLGAFRRVHIVNPALRASTMTEMRRIEERHYDLRFGHTPARAMNTPGALRLVDAILRPKWRAR